MTDRPAIPTRARRERLAAILNRMTAPLLLEIAHDLARLELLDPAWRDDDETRAALGAWQDESAVAQWDALAARTGDPSVAAVAQLRRALRRGERVGFMLDQLTALRGDGAAERLALVGDATIRREWDRTDDGEALLQMCLLIDRRGLVRALIESARARGAFRRNRRLETGAVAAAEAWLAGRSTAAQCRERLVAMYGVRRATANGAGFFALAAAAEDVYFGTRVADLGRILAASGAAPPSGEVPASDPLATALHARLACPSLVEGLALDREA